MHKNSVGIIGYRNHSKKLLDIITKIPKVKKIIVFCYKDKFINKLEQENKNKKITYTKKLSILKNDCESIFISSPSNTHYKYLNYFIKANKYIFCEKPGCINKNQLRNISKFPKKIKSKIYINYNLLHSNLYKFLINKKNLNKDLISMIYHSSTGIAYLKKFKRNWRFKSKDILQRITGNWGVHSTNLSLNLFGKLDKSLISEGGISSKQKIDTCSITLKFKNNKTSNIFLSYASPMSDEMTFFFKNKILKYQEGKVMEFSPRNYFDKKGLFKKPPKKSLNNIKGDISNNSLEKSVKYFINIAINNGYFPINLFNNAMETVRIFLNFDSQKNKL
tara:strand:- start:764 stop:1765 length:1002 start_codon:yes stop_codon:yes gene_type:complete